MIARRVVAAVTAVGLLVAGCATPGGGGAAGGAAPSRDAGDLSGVCPATVVVQLPWTPQAEYGGLYHLVGPDPAIDPARRSVAGALVSAGRDTGVRIELRSGGPTTGIESVVARMYADPSVMLGEVSTDDAIALSARQPVVAVLAPLDKAPYMIQWDPRQHPEFHSIADVGMSSTTVSYVGGATYMEVLVGSGVLRRDQVDGSYDGSPARWLASGGRIAQQGFATSEPYLYEKILPQWKRRVEFQLIHDAGYPIYPEALVVRTDRRAEHAACLKRLVPVIQRSQVEFVKDPDATIDLIVRANEAFGGPTYPAELARYSVAQQVKLGIVGNGANTTLGDFAADRVQKVIDVVTPAFAGQRREVKPGLTVADLCTNEFVDASIGLR
ncbi:hypothetical protein ACNTMW_09010 [Planosporangium sp. 12N6]|uniref:hypothetical protein n=1 Tax=Planosporangium spinosum TaxID=3402278 RepID=UPI003CEBFB7E